MNKIKTHIERYEECKKDYPTLNSVATVLAKSRSDIIGRDGNDIRKGLSNPEKANVLILGEPGTGKAIANDEWLPVADSRGYIPMGDVKVGDYVYDENGQPTKVIGVYPQGLQDAYDVRFITDTNVVCNDEHLWNVRTRKQHYNKSSFVTKTLRELMDDGITKTRICGDKHSQTTWWYVPKAKAIAREEKKYGIHPYVIGALLGDGCLTVRPLAISSNDEFVVNKVATLLHASGYEKKKSNYSWEFLRNPMTKTLKFIQPNELAALENIETMMKKKSYEKRIPPQYLLGSVQQRMQLLQGLMDTDGSVSDDKRLSCRFHTSSLALAQDVKTLAFSLGMNATMRLQKQESDVRHSEYSIHFLIPFSDKHMLFSLPRKLDVLHKHSDVERMFHKHYDDIGIKDVKYLNKQMEMTCIRVEAPSHLFQITKSHIVTHNTASVRGFAYKPETLATSIVLEVNPEMLINKGDDKETAMLIGFRNLVEEAGEYSKSHDVIVILFIDEFHKIVMYAPSAIEALKPILEKSAENYFRIIASTTFKEYSDNMAGNRAFDQRFLRLTLPELPKDAVLRILENTAYHWNLKDLVSPTILEEIYIESKSLLISNAQPRASLDILQAMVAEITKNVYIKDGHEYREFYMPQELEIASEYSISRPILKRAIKRMYSVDIDRGVDVKKVIHALNTRLFNQTQAVDTVASQLEMAAHSFGEMDRPKASFLSTGSTGTGKDLPDSELIPAPVKEGYIRNGDLKVGDFVYGRHGKPILVSGVFPQGLKTIYRMTLVDGRVIDCGKGHLWNYKSAQGNGARNWKTVTTEELMKKPLSRKLKDGRTEHSYVIPQSEAVERETKEYYLDPYVFGALLGNGSFRSAAVDFSSADMETVHQLECILGFSAKHNNHHNYSWYFITGKRGIQDTLAQTKDLLHEMPELIGKKSGEKFIPDMYKYGSIKQRWDLIQGLFDTDGTIKDTTRHQVEYSSTSKQLIDDMQEVLWSLGIASTVSNYSNKREWNESETTEHVLHVKAKPEDKPKFFRLTRKLDRAKQAVLIERARNKHYDTVAIASIEKLDYKESTTCIMVEDEEHLYLAGKGHIVTHNTELAKIISETMSLPLKRFDMSRYASDENAGAFADDLFHAAWSTPNAYLLIDEVEKSSRKAMNILLQVLDDARLNDSVNPDRVASFSGNIINLTTNLGSEVYQQMNMHKSDTAIVDTELIYKSLQDSSVFETAVLGRIDAIVPFRPLPFNALMKIAKRALQNMIDVAETDTRRIIVSDDVIQYIVKDRTSTDSERGGARDVKRNVKNLVTQVLAHYLTYAKDEVPVILYIKGRARFKHKEVADPLNAKVALKECYDISYINQLLQGLSKQVGKPLVNRGLYLPNDKDIKLYLQEITTLTKQGYNKFDSVMDEEECNIRGVA